MLVDSNAPFDHAFAAQHGAQVTATVDPVPRRQLAATARLSGVTAKAGPFAETTVSVLFQLPGGPRPGGRRGPESAECGRPRLTRRPGR